MKQTIILIIALAALMPGNAYAQIARLYSSESGLMNSQINDICQDRKGFIWISTENGLARYDGMNFSTFRFDRNKSTSISSNLVLTLYEDTEGVTWVGTSAGLQILDTGLNTFTTIDLEDDTMPESDPHISSVIEICYKGEKMILASSSGHGIYALNLHTHKISHQVQGVLNSMLSSRFISHLFLDSDSLLWIAYENGGLTAVDLRTDKTVDQLWDKNTSRYSGNVIVNDIIEDDSEENLFICTFNHGILVYEKEKGYIREAKDRSSSGLRVMTILENNIIDTRHDKSFLIGLENGGLRVFSPKEEKIEDVTLPQVPYNTSSWKIHSLYEDNQGNVWIGAFQTGVLVLPKSMYGFDSIHFDSDSRTINNSACVTSILGDASRNCHWIGTDGGGLFRLDNDGTIRNWSESDTDVLSNSIMSLAIDKRKTIWIATYLEGLVSYSPEEGFRRFKDSSSIRTNKTVALAYSETDDILYVGTHGYGLSIVDMKTEKVVRTLAEDEYKWISTLYLDTKGLLWVGTYNGPMCYDSRARKIIGFDVNQALSSRVQCFRETSDSKMWIGTGEGLVCFDRSTRSTVPYSESDGLPSNVVADIQESEDGDLWISTQNGLSRMDTSTGTFRNYYHYDGVQSNEFHNGASFKDNDGKLYFGGIKGITSFYPHIVDQRFHPVPPLYFSNLTVMNKHIDYDPQSGEGNVLDKNITEATQITLPYDENIFSIDFSVLEYTNPQKITYSYMMEGFDDDWNHTRQASRTATYTNLPSGRYVMKVKAYFDGEPEEFSYREIGIRILPPWYRSTLAFICYIILAMLCIIAFRQWKKRESERKREMEESEIKELKLRMFTNISHEIRTPLTLVMNPLKKMREAEKDPKQKELFNLMYRNSLRILRLVNQLLDMRKVDSGQMQLHFLETDVVYFIKDIMQSFDNLAVSKNIRFSISTVNEVTNLWIDQGNFDKIIFNILSNAFKHTPENGEISISISAPVENDNILKYNIKEYVEFTIENSGSNVEERHLDRLFDRFFQVDIKDAKEGSGVGLNLAKMLVELHHGDIRAYNTERGMAFSVKIPVGKDHLSAEEMTRPTNHKDLYTKAEDIHTSREDVTYDPEKAEKPDVRQTKSKKNIILVDDDSEMRSYLKLELQEIYNVESCANARDAWAKVSTTIPDAVITDLIMDGMDGAELCAKIKKNPGTNHIPVIILTSSSDEQNIQRCIDSGADRFFTKPLSLDILKGAVSNAISTRDTMRNKFSKEIDYGYQEIEMQNSGNRLIDKVIKIIRENMENPDFSVEDLSREVGMSRVHLNRKLKESMNISPSSLIRSMRLKQAAYLLINNKVNISEVAYKVGFSTHSYFSNSFHDYFGMTPKEFTAKYMNCKDEETLKKVFE